MSLRSLSMAFVALGLVSGAASAQQLHGGSVLMVGVADAETGAPLEGATVTMPDLLRSIRTSGALAQGWIRGVPAGALMVESRYVGYDPLQTPVYFAGDDTVEVVLLMKRHVRELEAVRIRAGATPSQMRQFQSHVDRGVGKFITGDELEKLGQHTIWSTIETRFPGITTVWDPTDHRYVVISKRGFTDFSFQPCRVQIVINGIIEPDTGAADILDVPATELAGIEYYDGPDAPIEWRRPGSGCGILAVWTKR